MSRFQKKLKQSTLDKLPIKSKDAIDIIHSQPDSIDITEIRACSRQDEELEVKISFKLPLKRSLSRLKANLWFNKQPINSVIIILPQSPLIKDELEFKEVLDMKGIKAGNHTITVELVGLWGLDEKLNGAINECTIHYTPQARRPRLIKVPSIKNMAGRDLVATTRNQIYIYQDMANAQKKEQLSKRDNW